MAEEVGEETSSKELRELEGAEKEGVGGGKKDRDEVGTLVIVRDLLVGGGVGEGVGGEVRRVE